MGIAKISHEAKITLSKIGRQAKIPHGLCAKLTAVVILGLCFIFIWSFFSTTPENLTSQRDSFSDIAELLVKSPVHPKVTNLPTRVHKPGNLPHKHEKPGKDGKNVKGNKGISSSIGNRTVDLLKDGEFVEKEGNEGSEDDDNDNEGSDDVVVDGKEEGLMEKQGENEGESEGDVDLENGLDVEIGESDEDDVESKRNGKGKKVGPVFDPKGQYSWKLCNVRSKHNYIPCIDIESSTKKVQRYRHFERTCPRTPPMCLVPLPPDGYETPVRWPESKAKILYKNVEHPKLGAYIKTEGWALQNEGYLVFPQNQTDVVNGVANYLQSIEEVIINAFCFREFVCFLP